MSSEPTHMTCAAAAAAETTPSQDTHACLEPIQIGIYLLRRFAENISHTPSAPQAMTQHRNYTHEQRIARPLHVVFILTVDPKL